ncbi:MAG: hypothetical protein IIX37_05810, partial [Selenomonadaceae bacterium]|nr:hypothetical protein [Selenomonadaceae bacterium]
MRYSETTGNVTLKDCVLTATATWAIHFDGKAGGNVTLDGCKVTGWVAFAGTLEKVTLKGSTF